MKRYFGLFVLVSALLPFEKAFALSTDAKALVYESYAFEEKRDYPKAIEKMVKALGSDEKDYFLNFRLGWLFSLDKKYKNSFTHYEKAASVAPKSLEPLLSLSLLYFNLGDFANAAATAEKVINLDPSNYYGLMRAISSNIKLKKYAQALPHAEEAVKYYPTDAIFLEQKGFLEVSLNKAAEGKETLKQLLLISPKNIYAKSILGAQ